MAEWILLHVPQHPQRGGSEVIFLSDLDGVGSNWDDLFDWHITTNWGHVPGIPLKHERKSFSFYDDQPTEVVDAIRAIMDHPGFYADLEPIEGWADAMHGIKALGHDVFIVTSPWLTNPTCVQDKLDWVSKVLGDEWAQRVIITKDKTLVHGDILVDDKPEISGVRTPNWEHVLFDQPYNQGLAQRRLLNWSDWPALVASKNFEHIVAASTPLPLKRGVIQHRRGR